MVNASATDQVQDAINENIDKLANDASLFTRWRLNSLRGREAVKLAETSMVEAMSAKRRVMGYQLGLTEDYVKKCLLSHTMKDTEVVEREIAQTIAEAVSNFESLILGQEEAAYRAEIILSANAHDSLKAGKISQRRYEQLIGSIESSTDKIVESAHRTTRAILATLERRSNAALQYG